MVGPLRRSALHEARAHGIPLKVLALAATVSAAAPLHAALAQSAPSAERGAECRGADAPVTVAVDSARRAVVVTIGPCRVPAMAMDMHDMSHMEQMAMARGPGQEDVRVHFRWPADVWMRSFDLKLFDGGHQPLPQATTVHHMELLNFDRRQILYPMVERLLGIGEETSGAKIPKSVGLPLDAGMDMALALMWNNMSGHDLDAVTVQLTIGYSPRNLSPRPVAVLPFKVDVNNRPGAIDAYNIPPGGGSRETVFTMPVSGRLLAAGGHLHDYGKEVRLEDVATGKVLARVTAHRTATGEVTGVSHGIYGVLRRGPHLIAGRQYRVVAVYEGSPTDSIYGAMGVMGGIFAPDNYAKWPRLDRSNPDYLKDLNPSERATAAATSKVASRPTCCE